MNIQDVNRILATSSQDDWIVDDESGTFTYRHDLNLHIQRADYDSFREFNEDWATRHPNPNAVSVEYVVKYGAAPVKRDTLVSVDGHRATLPMPKSATDLSVGRDDVNFARIVDVGGRVDEYLARSHIVVV
ncbi:MAG: hypothetical protein AB7D19_11850 [Acetobacter sp.]|nr:hypothetical protein [Acidomonas methanolica]GBQ55424.1 hypothetical protein AA0498_2254 [Acidomonas methanolica]